MKVLMLSSDVSAFKEGSAFQNRLKAYGECADLSVVVLCLKTLGLNPQDITPKVKIWPTNSLWKVLYGLDAFRVVLRLYKEKFDLVTSQDSFEIGLLARFISWFLGVPFEVQVHTDFLSKGFYRHSFANKIRVFLAGHILRRASLIRVVRPALKIGIVEKYGISGEKIYVLPINFLPTKEAAPKENGEPMRLLMACRLEGEKRVDLAILAFSILIKKGWDLMLVIAGDGSERKKLESLVSSLSLGHRVSFLGQVSDMESVYKMADLLISTSSYEGYGLSMVEAAGRGLPVVATRAGVSGDLFGEEDIFLSEDSTPEGFSKVIEEALGNQEGRFMRAKSARLKVKGLEMTLKDYAALMCSNWARVNAQNKK